MTQVVPSHWLTLARLKLCAAILLAFYPLMIAGWLFFSDSLVNASGKPVGADFITFWGGSHLALAGDPAGVFDADKIFAAEKAAIAANRSLFLWHYPPTFLLLILPLPLLPYLLAYVLWSLTTFAAAAAVARRFAPAALTWPLLLAFPATFINIFHGQNGLLTAALLGGGLLLLPQRPFIAGLLLGLMSYKPHFAVLLPLALVCGRQWTALAAATLSALLLAATSWAVLGSEVWIAFWNNLPVVRDILEQGRLPWAKIASVFVSLRTLGFDDSYAYAGQFMIAALVVITVAWIWTQSPGTPRAIAVLMAGTPLMTPYVFDYDLVLLALPIAILAWDGVTRGWHSGDREILVLAFFTPALVSIVAYASEIQIGPLCLMALFAMATRRALRAPERAPGAPPLPAPAQL